MPWTTCVYKSLINIHNKCVHLNLGIPKATVTSPFYNVVYGTRISLHCSVFSIPKITLIYWRKNVTGLVTTINSHAVGTDGITVDNPSLTILFPTHSDSGSYNCFASNVLGTSSSATTFLNIIGGTSSSFTTIFY